MLCAKREYDHDVIVSTCLDLKDLKSNKRYIFLYEI